MKQLQYRLEWSILGEIVKLGETRPQMTLDSRVMELVTVGAKPEDIKIIVEEAGS